MHICLDFLQKQAAGVCEEEREQPHWKLLSPMRNISRARSIWFTISALYIIFFSNRLWVAFLSVSARWSLSCKSHITYFHVPPYAPFFSLSCVRYLFSLLSFPLLFLFSCSRILWRLLTDFYRFRLDLSCYCVHKSDFIQFSSSKNLNNLYFNIVFSS